MSIDPDDPRLERPRDPEATGPHLTGSDPTGPDLTGPDLTGADLIGPDRLARIADATIAVVGLGRLAAGLLTALVAGGARRLLLIDDTPVGEADLTEPWLFDRGLLGVPRADAARTALARLAPEVTVEAVTAAFTVRTALDLILDADVLVDASGRRELRELANEVVEIRDIPLVWGDAAGWDGRVGVAWHARGLDFRDVSHEAPRPPARSAIRETSSTAAAHAAAAAAATSTSAAEVFAPLAGAVGALMAAETLKLVGGFGTPLLGRIAVLNARTGALSELSYERDPAVHPTEVPPVAAPLGSVAALGLEAELQGEAPPVLVDVREPWEVELAAIPGALNIPLGELGDRLGELDSGADTVVFCHHGVRSGRAVELLNRVGFRRARHLRGGIEAWSREVDPEVPRY